MCNTSLCVVETMHLCLQYHALDAKAIHNDLKMTDMITQPPDYKHHAAQPSYALYAAQLSMSHSIQRL